MELEHEFTVPVPVAEAWDVLLDVERIAPCMPGATLETIDGDSFTGKVKVKVGPIMVTYGGQARFAEKDAENHRAVIEAHGKEARGTGTAAATVHATLHSEGERSTKVKVVTDLAITGKPAQFGRGVMADVGGKIIGQFSACLAEQISAGTHVAEPAPTPAATGEVAPGAAVAAELPAEPGVIPPEAVREAPAPVPPTTPPPGPRVVPPRPGAEPIDLLGTAGTPVLKRLAPVLAGVLALVVVWRLLRRRKH
ncbi:MAG: SRPBCC family protein [Motilibacteraceae bacterium]